MAGNILEETNANGTAQYNYIYLNGSAIARKDVRPSVSSTDWYYLRDALGTTRMIQEGNGTIVYDRDYYPFGLEIATIGFDNYPQNYKFTGKERDPNTLLDYFGARYYSSTLARFMNPDPLPWSQGGRSHCPSTGNRRSRSAAGFNRSF